MSDIPYSVIAGRRGVGSLINLEDTNITLPGNTDDVLKYNNTTGKWENKGITHLTGAGGDLPQGFLLSAEGGGGLLAAPLKVTYNVTDTEFDIYSPLGNPIAKIQADFTSLLARKLHLSIGGLTSGKGLTITENGRVGINVTAPTEDLELDGNIQLDTGGVQRGRVIFYDKQNGHEHAEVDGIGEGTNGGALVFYTKVDGGSVTEKLRISHQGEIGIGGANYGTAGQVLTSNGSGSSVSWTTLSGSGTPYTGGTGVTIDASNVISIGQSVGTSDDVTFNRVSTGALPTLPSQIGYNTSILISSGTTIATFPAFTTLASITLQPGVWRVKGYYTVNNTSTTTNYGILSYIVDATTTPVINLVENFTAAVNGGYTTIYASDIINVPYTSTKTIQLHGSYNGVGGFTVQTISTGKFNVVRLG